MEYKNFLDFEAIAFSEKGIGYASAFESNGLYRVNLDSQNCEYIMLFPNEDISRKRIYVTAIYHEQKVYFVPMSGNYISIYDIEQNIINQISIPLPSTKYSFYKEQMKFSAAIYYNGYIYIFPFTYPGILKLNVNTNEIVVLNDWIPREGYFFRGGLCVDGLYVYIPNGIDNMILEFNIETEQAIINHVGTHNNGAMCIHKYGDCYWIAPRLKGSIIIWNPNNNVVNEITEYPNVFITGKIVFSKIICCGTQLFFMPASANNVLAVNKKTNKLTIENKWKPHENAMVVCMFETEDYYYFREINASHKLSKRYRIHKADGKTEEYAFVVENREKYIMEYFKASMAQGKIMRENDSINLEDFLKGVTQEDNI